MPRGLLFRFTYFIKSSSHTPPSPAPPSVCHADSFALALPVLLSGSASANVLSSSLSTHAQLQVFAASQFSTSRLRLLRPSILRLRLMPASLANDLEQLLDHTMDFVGKAVDENSRAKEKVGGGLVSYIVGICFELRECKDTRTAVLQ